MYMILYDTIRMFIKGICKGYYNYNMHIYVYFAVIKHGVLENGP